MLTGVTLTVALCLSLLASEFMPETLAARSNTSASEESYNNYTGQSRVTRFSFTAWGKNGDDFHDKCSAVFCQYLTDLHGSVSWEGGNNSADCSWVVSLNSSYGVVLRVDEVTLINDDSDVTVTDDNRASDATPTNDNPASDVTSTEDNSVSDMAPSDDNFASDVRTNDGTLTVYRGTLPQPNMMVSRLVGDLQSVEYINYVNDINIKLPVSIVPVYYNHALIRVVTPARRLVDVSLG
ncbi:hypothetical protein BaRGS_00013575 [Batillaria attramentaria]|uniref:Uncharacterized protein n=1 Tax=Batillaria attramentaria TaxID=370345 RepID=A0ABD0L7E3_9CAEN